MATAQVVRGLFAEHSSVSTGHGVVVVAVLGYWDSTPETDEEADKPKGRVPDSVACRA
jgi:hypothetical protein